MPNQFIFDISHRNIPPVLPPQPQYLVGPPSIYTIPQAELKAGTSVIYLVSLFSLLKSITALTSRPFYLIDFESSCVANVFPCEVAIVSLTFSSQVAQHPDNLHRFIDSSPIPGR
jgi:hypothetical protein